jgi:hypothetical protein
MDLDPAIFVIDLQDANKKINFFNIFSAYYFLNVHLHNFSKKKVKKSHKIVGIKVFFYYFCMMIEGSGSGSRPIPLTDGSGSGSRRPKNMWIRIRNTALVGSRLIFSLQITLQGGLRINSNVIHTLKT